jgi:hypothetical protein
MSHDHEIVTLKPVDLLFGPDFDYSQAICRYLFTKYFGQPVGMLFVREGINRLVDNRVAV